MYFLKAPGKFLYYFTKVNGLVPLSYDFDKGKAFLSTPSAIYSIFFTLILSSFLIYYVYALANLIMDQDKELVIVLVLILDVIILILKTIIIYTLQLIRRQKIVVSINYLVKICELIFEHESNHKLRLKSFFNKKFMKTYRRKCIYVCIQMLSLLSSFCIYDYDNISSSYVIQNCIFVLYTNFATIFLTNVFYYGGMLISARFYQILNKKIKKINSINGGLPNENTIYEIEKISFLYEHITIFMSNVSYIYGFQIIILLMGIIVWVLAAVRIFSILQRL